MGHHVLMATTALPVLTSGGIELDTSPERFGFLRNSTNALADVQELRSRMETDGYLFLPGFFKREDVRAARLAICQVLAEDGQLSPDEPVESAICRPDLSSYFRPDIANGSRATGPLHEVIYGERMMAFMSRFLGGDAMHYDFTWLRTMGPGNGSQPHCDVVYMGRGTHNLYTAWVPLGDVPLHVGGLILIEGSHHDHRLRNGYCEMDVDTACQNREGQSQTNAAGFTGFGALSDDMRSVHHEVGGRLLTAEQYHMGDLLLFSVFTVHGSLDNHSREVRLSSDSRYQLASEPADERWIGENPPGHGGGSVRGMIC